MVNFKKLKNHEIQPETIKNMKNHNIHLLSPNITSVGHPLTWIQRKSHRFGQGAHVDGGKIGQDWRHGHCTRYGAHVWNMNFPPELMHFSNIKSLCAGSMNDCLFRIFWADWAHTVEVYWWSDWDCPQSTSNVRGKAQAPEKWQEQPRSCWLLMPSTLASFFTILLLWETFKWI